MENHGKSWKIAIFKTLTHQAISMGHSLCDTQRLAAAKHHHSPSTSMVGG